MSKKRTSTESSNPNDEETNEDSDVSRQEDNAKRGKFASFSDTTLQDIPTEILQCILVKAITMEVQNMKLVKSVWKEKADLVISRLGSVCSQWSSVLTTDFFRLELHRALDGIAQQKIRMEIVQESLIDHCLASGIAALKDDIFLLCIRFENENTPERSLSYNITVYDRNNMAEVKAVIELPGGYASYNGEIAACSVSNCVYVLKEKCESQCASVLRITTDENQKFNIQSWISVEAFSVSSISVSDDGRVILCSIPDDGPNVASVYNPNGLLHQEVVLPPDIYGFDCVDSRVIRKSNGNLVLASVLAQFERHVDVTEIDTNGIIQRQYESPLDPENEIIFISFVDAFGRILIHDRYIGFELLDSELNLLESTVPQSDPDDDDVDYVCFDGLHFNRERNEVIGICDLDSDKSRLKIFRFIEE